MQPFSDLLQPAELYLSCRNLKDGNLIGKSDPQVRVFIENQRHWKLLGETEKISNNLNPDFKTAIKVDYMFETKQPLRFEVYDLEGNSAGDLVGSVETSVGEIMGARKQTATFDLHNESGKVTGQLIVKGDKVGTSEYDVVWQWSGVKLMDTNCIFGNTNPFLRFFKERSGEWLQVHETEFIKNSLNPVWRVFKVNDDKLCGTNHTQPIRIECWDNKSNGKHRYIGYCEVSLERLKNGEKSFQLFNAIKNKNSGTLNLLSFQIRDKITFLDYIKGGEQLNTILAIDFTASNWPSISPDSLHYRLLPEGQLNEYQKVIKGVCQIILDYDFDKTVPVYGFGANLRFDTMPKGISPCFPCSGLPDKPEAHGLSGIMDVYRHALEHTVLACPTLFGPVLKEAINAALINKKNDVDVYTICLIMTDGFIDDMKETTEILVDASELPLSVIIIGVGKANFDRMETLGDIGLRNKAGKKVARDFVQFLPFRNFKDDMEMLAKHVLSKVPGQLVEYKTLLGKMPK